MNTYKKIYPKGIETFFNLSDGKNIIYCEKSGRVGYNISSVHQPSREVGTGYRLAENVEITANTVNKLLPVYAPEWAKEYEIKHTKKWPNLYSFIAHEKKFFNDLVIEDITLN